MPAEVINRVDVLARRQLGAGHGLQFTDCHGNPLFDPDDDNSDNDNNSYHPGSEHDDDEDLLFDDHDGPIAGVYGKQNNKYGEQNNAEEHNNKHNDKEDVNYHAEEVAKADAEEHNNEEEVDDNAEEVAEADLQDEEEIDEVPTITIEQEMDARYGARTGCYALQPRRPCDHSHMHVTFNKIALTQHLLKKGIKEFGTAGVDAVLKELQQLHDQKVLEPRDTTTLSKDERQAALQYLMFLKQRRNGVIKGRSCADGRKQRNYTTKEEASSPTVAVEALLLLCVIDAQEGRDVATADIPGAFMQADMEDVVHMKLEGLMGELLVKIDPAPYRKHVLMEKGKQVLYVELKKALYGTLKAALLFWKS